MASAGVHKDTFSVLRDFDDVRQSIETIFTTPRGSRVMRRLFGNDGLRLIGEKLTPMTMLIFSQAIRTAIDLQEPRFRVTRVSVEGTTGQQAGQGGVNLLIEGEYMPRGHLGDKTVDRRNAGRVSITLGAA